MKRCAHCGRTLYAGRRRVYCTRACQQAAYRARRRALTGRAETRVAADESCRDWRTGATFRYGIAAEHLADGERDRAIELLQDITSDRNAWPAFGFIAAETMLDRLR